MTRHNFFVVALLLTVASQRSAEADRAVVISSTDDRVSTAACDVRVIDMATGKTIATRTVGATAEGVLSPDARLLAVSSRYSTAGTAQPNARLEYLKTDDLSVVDSGQISVPRSTLFRTPSRSFMAFSPNGNELLIERMESYRTSERPHRFTVDEIVLTQLARERDDSGTFPVTGKEMKVPRARGLFFLRTADWPTITVWNPTLTALEVLDLKTGSIKHRLMITDDPTVQTFDVAHLEKPEIGNVVLRLNVRNMVISDNGDTGYFIPQQSTRTSISHLRRINIRTDSPNITASSEQLDVNLRATVSAVSEAAGAIFALEENFQGSLRGSSSRVHVFHTSNLTKAGTVQLPIKDCTFLGASRDGKYLYALDYAGGKIAVCDVMRGSDVRSITSTEWHPAIIFPLP